MVKQKKTSQAQPRPSAILQQPTPPSLDEWDGLEGGDAAMDEQSEKEKDDTELALEKLVFGDDAAFRHAISDHARRRSHSLSESDEATGEERGSRHLYAGEQALEELADADVCYGWELQLRAILC